MLNTLERVLKSRIEMYEMFIGSRYILGMDSTENIARKKECEELLMIVRSANKK